MLDTALLKELQAQSKYLTRYDKNYLNTLHKQQEALTPQQEEMLAIILDAVVRRVEKDNFVTDIPDSWVAVYKKYYKELSEKEQSYLRQLHEFQWWSYTRAQQYIIDILNERIKLLYKQNKK